MAETVKANEYFTESGDGSIEFTQAGKKVLAPMFADLGVNIADVKTKAEADRLVDQSVAQSLEGVCEDEE
jgi:hypothetical protein